MKFRMIQQRLIPFHIHSPTLLRRFGQRVFHYLGIKNLLEEKFKEDEVPDTPAHQPARKIKGLQDLPFLCRPSKVL